MQIASHTKNIPSAPGFVEALKHSHRREGVNLDLFDHPFPCRFGIDDEFIPNPLLNLRLVPLFMIKHFVVPFDPNGPKRNASIRRCQIVYIFPYFLGSLSPNKSCFQLKLS
jgi:hypothetical protein